VRPDPEALERPVARQLRSDVSVLTLPHELATLALTTTDQCYIFMWVGITVIALFRRWRAT
jgi:hypothetical protein